MHSLPPRLQEEFGSVNGCGIRIGIVDSGWDPSHSVDVVEPGVAFRREDGKRDTDTTDRVGHGTACTGLIHRIAPEARLTPIRIFHENKSTSLPALVHSLQWAATQDFDVLNLSLGTTNEDSVPYLYKACEVARRNGTIVVAAMHHGELKSYPSAFDNVISVGSLIDLDHPLDFYFRLDDPMECLAMRGPHDVLWLDGETKSQSGASYGAPNVTGLIALLIERHGRMPLDDVRRHLRRLALEEPTLA